MAKLWLPRIHLKNFIIFVSIRTKILSNFRIYNPPESQQQISANQHPLTKPDQASNFDRKVDDGRAPAICGLYAYSNLIALRRNGKNWDLLDRSVPTRTPIQIRSHAQSFFENIKKEFSVEDPVDYIMGLSSYGRVA